MHNNFPDKFSKTMKLSLLAILALVLTSHLSANAETKLDSPFVGYFDTKFNNPNSVFAFRLKCFSESKCILVIEQGDGHSPPFINRIDKPVTELNDQGVDYLKSSLSYTKQNKALKPANRDDAALLEKMQPFLNSKDAQIDKCISIENNAICTILNSPWDKPALALFMPLPTKCVVVDAFCGYLITPLFKNNQDLLIQSTLPVSPPALNNPTPKISRSTTPDNFDQSRPISCMPSNQQNIDDMGKHRKPNFSDLKEVRIKLGDTLEQIKSLYPNSPSPQADSSGRIGMKAIHLADEGIWISLDNSDKVYAVKLDAPFHGAIAGLKIGDSAEILVKLLGAPSLKIVVPNHPESFTYHLVEDAVVNYSFDNLCTITSIVLFATSTNTPANSAFKPSKENEMPELAKRLNCSACHSISRRVVGPAWVDVSSRYKNATNFEYQGKEYPLKEGLLLKVSQGGSGHWGQMPMPPIDPNGHMQTDIKELITFILGLSK